VKKASQTNALPLGSAMHRPEDKHPRKSQREIDAVMRQHVSFPI